MRGFGTRQDYYSASPFLGLASPPPVTRFLLWGSAGVFLVVFALRYFGAVDLMPVFGLSAAGISRGFVWQALTYSLLHPGVLSLLFNMLVFWLFGAEVETVLGSSRFARLIAAGVAVAAAAYTITALIRPQPLLVGGDAIVFSLLCAYGLLFPHREITLLLLLIFPVRMKAGWLALLLAGVTVLMSTADAGPQSLFALAAGPAAWLMLRGGGLRARESADCGVKVLFARVARKLYRPATAPAARGAESGRVAKQEIDRILDKISAHGFQSLTAAEKNTLDRARDMFRSDG